MKNQLTIISIIIAAGMIISAYALSRLYLNIRNEESIKVKGVAEQKLTSDIGKLYFSVVESGEDMSGTIAKVRTSYTTLLEDLKKRFGSEVQFFEQEPDCSAVQKCVVHPDGKKTFEFSHYEATNSCKIVTTNVNVIAEINKTLTAYSINHTHINASAPEYLISDISEVKLRLLKEATANGWERAKALVSGKGTLGELVCAKQGVFQITEPYSTDSCWDGIYDKSTIEKNIKAVVTLEYAAK